MHKTIALLVLIALSASAWGQDSTHARNRMKFGLSLAGGVQREFLASNDLGSPEHSVFFVSNLNWGWRVQCGVVGDRPLGQSRFGIRMGLAVGLRKVDYSWWGLMTTSDDLNPSPVLFRFDQDQLEFLADLKLALRYRSRTHQPWIALVGGFYNASTALHGKTWAIHSNAFELLVDCQCGERAFGAFAQVSKQFRTKVGALEPTLEARWRPFRGTFGTDMNSIMGMVGLQFWPGLSIASPQR